MAEFSATHPLLMTGLQPAGKAKATAESSNGNVNFAIQFNEITKSTSSTDSPEIGLAEWPLLFNSLADDGYRLDLKAFDHQVASGKALPLNAVDPEFKPEDLLAALSQPTEAQQQVIDEAEVGALPLSDSPDRADEEGLSLLMAGQNIVANSDGKILSGSPDIGMRRLKVNEEVLRQMPPEWRSKLSLDKNGFIEVPETVFNRIQQWTDKLALNDKQSVDSLKTSMANPDWISNALNAKLAKEEKNHSISGTKEWLGTLKGMGLGEQTALKSQMMNSAQLSVQPLNKAVDINSTQFQTQISANDAIAMTSITQSSTESKESGMLTQPTTPLVLYSKNWQSDVSQKIRWMVGAGVEKAEIQLDPKELGPLIIRVTQTNGEMNLQIQANHSQTRELFEQNQERMKEMLQQNGIELSQFDVQSEQHFAKSGDGEDSGEPSVGSTAEAEEQAQVTDTSTDVNRLLDVRV